MQIKLTSYTALGSCAVNEDAVACDLLGSGLAYAVVCDGLGGQMASRIAVNQLQTSGFQQLPSREQILDWMNRTNQEILSRRSGPDPVKTTAAALFISQNRAVWAHIGDSRLYHFYNGRLADITEDDSKIYSLVREGKITRRDIPSHRGYDQLLKYLGDNAIHPSIHEPITLAPGHHAFLLCTDGLWERLHEDEIMLDLHKCQTPEQWLFNLRCRAEMRKFTNVDNNSAAAIFVTI